MAKTKKKAKKKQGSVRPLARYRAAIIGCGSMAGGHARGYHKLNKVSEINALIPDRKRC